MSEQLHKIRIRYLKRWVIVVSDYTTEDDINHCKTRVNIVWDGQIRYLYWSSEIGIYIASTPWNGAFKSYDYEYRELAEWQFEELVSKWSKRLTSKFKSSKMDMFLVRC